MKATAIAHPNLALVKYWGKRNAHLILPQNGSISVTLDCFSTTTTVAFSSALSADTLVLNGKTCGSGTQELEHVSRFLDVVRAMSGTTAKARVVSRNDFPTAAGFASSSSGFAALAAAVNAALQLDLDNRRLSMLARRGSGSACRSVHGGFAEWLRGEKEDGSDSYAVQLSDEQHWPAFRVIACTTSAEKKRVSSREGMQHTVATSPLYAQWLRAVRNDLVTMRAAIRDRDIAALGSVAEANCLRMHATLLASRPPVTYWTDRTRQLMHAVIALRDGNRQCYFTSDAGPQVKVICLAQDAAAVQKVLAPLCEETHLLRPGLGIKTTEEHLF